MLRLLFEKKGDSVWISHLDLMRVFQRAFRRAGLLLKHSQGFTPRAIVSIALPLSVGTESNCELLDFELEGQNVPPEEITAMLNDKLPSGIRVLQTYEAVRKIKELTHLRAYVLFTYDHGIPMDAEQSLKELYARDTLVLEKHSRKGDTQTDILPLIQTLRIERINDRQLRLDVVVCAQNPALNPQLLVTAVERYLPSFAPDASEIFRAEVYGTDGTIFR